jgi:hypothetical protein
VNFALRTLCVVSQRVFFCCKRIFRYRLSPESFGYTLVHTIFIPRYILCSRAVPQNVRGFYLANGLEKERGKLNSLILVDITSVHHALSLFQIISINFVPP